MVPGENTHASSPMWKVPTTFTPLLGREREVAAIGTFLTQAQTRLLTLIGAAGIGKTRLSLEVANSLRFYFADGVCFVELAALRDPGLVVPTLAKMFDIREDGPQPIAERLKGTLRDKHLLLLLDNFEHLIPAASEVEELLAACPALKVVTTSRSALRVQAEYLIPVAPLALPDLSRLPEPEVLACVAAVALFVQRAQAIRPDFRLTAANARAIAEICVRLDGLPLAIELAAARISVLSAQELLARLSSRLGLLTRGAWNLPERHQTLRKAIGWSYDLLPAEEQWLFRSLSVFAGGCTLEAVEALWAALRENQGAEQILDGVASLIDKSLVQQREQEDGESRLVMLEMVREYALERLEASSEAEATRRSHAEYFLILAERAEPEVRSTQQISWIGRLEQEYDNMRAALRWFIANQVWEKALRLSSALCEFWHGRGYLSEGQQWLEQALIGKSKASALVQAKALLGAAKLNYYQGDWLRATALLEEGLPLARQLGDTRLLAALLNILGATSDRMGNETKARALYEESLALSREVGNRRGVAQSLLFLTKLSTHQGDYAKVCLMCEEALALSRALGDRWDSAVALLYWADALLFQGKYMMARSCAEEGLALSKELGNRRRIATAFNTLGNIALYQGDIIAAHTNYEKSLATWREVGTEYAIAGLLCALGQLALYQGDSARARSLLEESLATSTATGFRVGAAQALCGLGRVALHRGDFKTARARYEESAAISSALDHKWDAALCLDGLGYVSAAEGNGVRAAQLWGAAQNLRESMDVPLPPVERPIYERAVATARIQVGEQIFAAAWEQGRVMALEQILAVPEQTTTGPVPVVKPSHPPTYPHDLSGREMEVLRLVAQGLTNAQIAGQLVLSHHTVNNHVRSILSKLGVASRSGATRFAIEHKLL